MPLFHYWQNFFRATFLWATLLTQSVFQFSWKKFMVIRALFLGPMNYKFAKKFLVFYENFQFPGSRRQLEEKFEIFWKNQKTTFLLKKFFFLRWDIRGVSGRRPGEGIKFFHPRIGREMMKTLTLINLASKSRFYYISQNRPIFRSEFPEDVSTVIF